MYISIYFKIAKKAKYGKWTNDGDCKPKSTKKYGTSCGPGEAKQVRDCIPGILGGALAPNRTKRERMIPCKLDRTLTPCDREDTSNKNNL